MDNSTFGVSIEDRYFEDYVTGSVFEFGSSRVEEQEVIAFGKRYDPQTFHTDPSAAQQSIYGGLIASGWHTAAMTMRLFCDHFLSHVASLGSPGVEELRWPQAVRPGDTLSIRVTIVETRRSRSKPERGILRTFVEVLNQDRTVVMTMKAVNLLLCRERP
jgi:acyl dehydratase